jgi:hypothetical protein
VPTSSFMLNHLTVRSGVPTWQIERTCETKPEELVTN